MKYYIISVANLKSTGKNEPGSVIRFLASVKDAAMDDSSVLAIIPEEIQKKRIPGLSAFTKTSVEFVHFEGDVKQYGTPLIADARFELRKMT